ncbi:MAG: cupin domain-containing protein, partial [Burkholderiales bacterium]
MKHHLPRDSRGGSTPGAAADAPDTDADAGLIGRVKQRVMAALAKRQDAAYATVRAADSGWEALAPGVERKILHVSPAGQSALWRLAPGGAVPGHLHDCDEECLVHEGTLRI